MLAPKKTQDQNFSPQKPTNSRAFFSNCCSPETATLQIITTYDMFVRGLVIISPLGIGFCEGLVGTCRSLEDVFFVTEKIRSRKISIKKLFSRHIPPFWRASFLLVLRASHCSARSKPWSITHFPAFRIPTNKMDDLFDRNGWIFGFCYEISGWVLSCI